MLIIISFWICFGIFALLLILNSDFLEDKLRGLLAFFALTQTMFIIGSLVLGQSILEKFGANQFVEWFIALLITAFALWEGIFVGLRKTIKDIFRKMELIEEETNILPKIQDDTKNLVEGIKFIKRNKK